MINLQYMYPVIMLKKDDGFVNSFINMLPSKVRFGGFNPPKLSHTVVNRKRVGENP